ncbi:NYN domain-containing protein [Pseudomonas aeruginosa]|uniref:NYN domain-containing protein n=1 Tax=Pseudomonas aeruginosa TaxID=287 RepID=UPI00099646C1|nr:NYN domain-containing protein [Pseudomonas aeruginosa]MBX5662870.1 NYN domain-containing protein [Pseudomonas aeruginosa]MBX5712037.1 NYN domain-containing protein [Pseudomonas aeruginosa]MBX5864602.1 NYN domain-containing protein [Pseudomonas aeruginosa]MBX5901827.1 NYN domain-containing protein [Pseudomonas aeruginosa]MBX6233773.1 NYN domain-containing protein [Pseudomonas aeruginosa]
MDRFAVMVDAGYLLRQSVEILSSKASTKRQELDITDPAGLIKLLLEKSRSLLDLGDRELLRVYWYDGVMSSGMTPQQKSIVELPDVHFRAGTVNSANQQKGVDSLIVTDLLELAANHAIWDAALITGDGDLAVGIELAQKKGVRIAIIGAEDLSAGVSHKQSFELTSRADRVGRIGSADLSVVMRHVAAPPKAASPTASAATAPSAPATTAAAPVAAPSSPSSPSTSGSSATTVSTAAASKPPVRQLDSAGKAKITAAVQSFIKSQATLAGAIDPSTKRIESSVDRALIHHVFEELSAGKLTGAEKIFAREVFRSELGVS